MGEVPNSQTAAEVRRQVSDRPLREFPRTVTQKDAQERGLASFNQHQIDFSISIDIGPGERGKIISGNNLRVLQPAGMESVGAKKPYERETDDPKDSCDPARLAGLKIRWSTMRQETSPLGVAGDFLLELY